jgi:hypothetical protein
MLHFFHAGMLHQVKVWDTVAPSSGSSPCVGSAHLNSNRPPIAMKCHESLCYIAAGAQVTAIDLRTMKKASVLALQNHRILSCEMMPSEWLICTGHYIIIHHDKLLQTNP